jgi:glycerol-3-phosphate dehydrogenase (NAD(P)+)
MTPAPLVGVVGGGDFGRALAGACARGCGAPVRLLTRRRAEISDVEVVEHAAAIAECELVFLAIPSAHSKSALEGLAGHLDGRHLVVHVSRGLVDAAGPANRLVTVSELVRQTTAVRRVGALAGPVTASALRRGDPFGAILGSEFPEVVDASRRALACEGARVYGTSDLVGVELGSALCGLLLVVVGMAQAVGLAPSLLGLLASRGLAEVARIGAAAGARHETFHGLAFVGDLFAAASGETRPEVAYGRALVDTLGTGRNLDVIESVQVAERVAAFAEAHAVPAPVTAMLVAVLRGSVSRTDAIKALLERPVGHE